VGHPTSNLVADHHHIRVAVGRDYADARRGLSVAFASGPPARPVVTAHEVPTHMPWVSREVQSSLPRPDLAQQQQQQQ
jgi:hypothetical protein